VMRRANMVCFRGEVLQPRIQILRVEARVETLLNGSLRRRFFRAETEYLCWRRRCCGQRKGTDQGRCSQQSRPAEAMSHEYPLSEAPPQVVNRRADENDAECHAGIDRIGNEGID